MKRKSIAIFYSPEEAELVKTLHKGIKEYRLDEAANIDIFTYVKEFNFPMVELYSFPKIGLEESVLEAVKNDFINENPIFEKANFKVVFTEDVKYKALCDIKNGNYDLVVCTIRKRDALDNFFSSSFIDYLIGRSKVDLLVIK